MITETQSQCCSSQALLQRCGEPFCQTQALHTCTLSSLRGESQGELSCLGPLTTCQGGPGSATEAQLNPQKHSSYLLTRSLSHFSACGSTALATRDTGSKGCSLLRVCQDASLGRVLIPLGGWIPAQMSSDMGHLTLLPVVSSTSAPRKAGLTPKD